MSAYMAVYLMSRVITTHDWSKWASIFGDDGGFEIYETTTKTYTSNEIYNVIGGPIRYIFEMWEVLDDIKTRFFELDLNKKINILCYRYKT